MSSTTTRRLRRSLLGGSAAVLALALGSSPVFAESQIYQTGTVGVHSLNDRSNKRELCHYDKITGRLQSFEFQNATLYAIDKNALRNSQKVGLQLIVERRMTPHARWQRFYEAETITARAYDDVPATFTNLSVSTSFPDDSSAYRARARMSWYKHGNTVGMVLAQYKWFTETNDSDPSYDVSMCYGQIGAV
jgi:hypothetical protein